MNIWEMIAAVETDAREVLRAGMCLPEVRMQPSQLTMVVGVVSRSFGQTEGGRLRAECDFAISLTETKGKSREEVKRIIQIRAIAAQLTLEKVSFQGK